MKLLIFWPIYLCAYLILESALNRRQFHVIASPLDELIPFSEWFVIPYVFWYVYLLGMVAYTLFFDVPVFRKLMSYLILTTCAAYFVYLIYPSCQNLRPAAFPRDNGLTRFVGLLYAADTNTNVCPSLHVMHALAVMTAGFRARGLQTHFWRGFFAVSAVLIILSTALIKQHSILDTAAALPLCAAAEWITYGGETWQTHFTKKTA